MEEESKKKILEVVGREHIKRKEKASNKHSWISVEDYSALRASMLLLSLLII